MGIPRMRGIGSPGGAGCAISETSPSAGVRFPKRV